MQMDLVKFSDTAACGVNFLCKKCLRLSVKNREPFIFVIEVFKKRYLDMLQLLKKYTKLEQYIDFCEIK